MYARKGNFSYKPPNDPIMTPSMTRKRYSEKYLEAKLTTAMRARGGMSIKLHGATMAGLPDRLLLCKGKACFAEVKTTGQHPTPLQRSMHRQLSALGFTVFIVSDLETLETTVDYATR